VYNAEVHGGWWNSGFRLWLDERDAGAKKQKILRRLMGFQGLLGWRLGYNKTLHEPS
jgi:hypothetical protein